MSELASIYLKNIRLTGVPTVITPSEGNNSPQVANTEYVMNEIDDFISHNVTAFEKSTWAQDPVTKHYYIRRITENDLFEHVYEEPTTAEGELKHLVIRDSTVVIRRMKSGNVGSYYWEVLSQSPFKGEFRTMGKRILPTLEWSILSDGTCAITGLASNVNNETRISIPSSMVDENGRSYPVTVISPYAFSGYQNVVEFIIPEGVTTIGTYAFSGCSSLEKVTFPVSTLKSIGAYAFQNCTSLNNVIIPDSVTTIEHHCFQFCTSLDSIQLSHNSNYTKLEDNLFANTKFDHIVIPDNVTVLGGGVFYGVAPSSEHIVVEAYGLQSLGANIFYASNAKSFTLKVGDAFGKTYYEGTESVPAWNYGVSNVKIEIPETNPYLKNFGKLTCIIDAQRQPKSTFSFNPAGPLSVTSDTQRQLGKSYYRRVKTSDWCRWEKPAYTDDAYVVQDTDEIYKVTSLSQMKETTDTVFQRDKMYYVSNSFSIYSVAPFKDNTGSTIDKIFKYYDQITPTRVSAGTRIRNGRDYFEQELYLTPSYKYTEITGNVGDTLPTGETIYEGRIVPFKMAGLNGLNHILSMFTGSSLVPKLFIKNSDGSFSNILNENCTCRDPNLFPAVNGGYAGINLSEFTLEKSTGAKLNRNDYKNYYKMKKATDANESCMVNVKFYNSTEATFPSSMVYDIKSSHTTIDKPQSNNGKCYYTLQNIQGNILNLGDGIVASKKVADDYTDTDQFVLINIFPSWIELPEDMGVFTNMYRYYGKETTNSSGQTIIKPYPQASLLGTTIPSNEKWYGLGQNINLYSGASESLTSATTESLKMDTLKEGEFQANYRHRNCIGVPVFVIPAGSLYFATEDVVIPKKLQSISNMTFRSHNINKFIYEDRTDDDPTLTFGEIAISYCPFLEFHIPKFARFKNTDTTDKEAGFKEWMHGLGSFTNITVDRNHPNLFTKNGVLYLKHNQAFIDGVSSSEWYSDLKTAYNGTLPSITDDNGKVQNGLYALCSIPKASSEIYEPVTSSDGYRVKFRPVDGCINLTGWCFYSTPGSYFNLVTIVFPKSLSYPYYCYGGAALSVENRFNNMMRYEIEVGNPTLFDLTDSYFIGERCYYPAQLSRLYSEDGTRQSIEYLFNQYTQIFSNENVYYFNSTKRYSVPITPPAKSGHNDAFPVGTFVDFVKIQNVPYMGYIEQKRVINGITRKRPYWTTVPSGTYIANFSRMSNLCLAHVPEVYMECDKFTFTSMYAYNLKALSIKKVSPANEDSPRIVSISNLGYDRNGNNALEVFDISEAVVTQFGDFFQDGTGWRRLHTIKLGKFASIGDAPAYIAANAFNNLPRLRDVYFYTPPGEFGNVDIKGNPFSGCNLDSIYYYDHIRDSGGNITVESKVATWIEKYATALNCNFFKMTYNG